MTSEKFQLYFFIGLLVAITALVLLILKPYLSALVLAAVLAVLFYPLHRQMLRLCRGWSSTAALITTVLILVIVITPLTIMGLLFFQEAKQFLESNTTSSTPILPTYTVPSTPLFQEWLPAYTLDVTQTARQALSWLLSRAGSVFTQVASLLLNIFISLFALYYFLRDGERLKRVIISFSPLLDRYDQQIFKRLQLAINSVVKGSLVVALIQGVLAGIGMVMFGIPQPVLWGSATVIAALIPSVGTAIIIYPIAFFMIISGNSFAGMGFAIWGALVVGLIDNFVRSKLIERGLNIHPLLILLSVLGGLGFFGPIGFILGPLVLSFFFALLDIYPLLISATRTSPSRRS